MGTALTGLEIKDTYDSLIKVTDNGPLSGSLKTLTDGLGNDSALALSTAAVSVTGALSASGLIKSTVAGAGFRHFYNDGSALIEVSQRSDNKLQLYAYTGSAYTDILLGVDGSTVGGNVGIGTNAPATKLDVSGDARFGGGATKLSVYSDSTYSGIFNGATLASNESIYMGDSQTFFLTAGTEKVRITSAGNVGIGTSAPFVASNQTSLTINGTNTARVDLAQGGTRRALLYVNATEASLQTLTAIPLTFVTNNVERMRITSTGDTEFGDGNNFNPVIQYAGSGRVAASPAYSFRGDLDTGMFNPNLGNTIAFATAATERMRIDSTGNVGIGTSSPTHNLTVGSASPSDFVIALRGGVGGFLGWDDSANATILQSPNTRALVFQVNSDTFSGGTEAMRITSTGNVGIGTTSGTSRANILSATVGQTVLTLEGNYAGSGSVELLEFNRSGGAVSGAIKYQDADTAMSIGTTTSHAFLFNTGDTEKMRITSAGNVGIGTSTPAQKLRIKAENGDQLGLDNAGERFTQISFLNNAAQKAAIWLDETDDEFAIYAAAGYTTPIYANGVERVRVTPNGLTFNGDTAAANALDDYEEGTWTATLIPLTSGTITLSVNSGTYTKIGREVTIKSQIRVDSVASPVGTAVSLGGLPFTSINSVAGRGSGSATYFPTVGAGSLLVNYQLQNSLEWNLVTTASSIAAGDEFYITLTYFV
jgi:hypothetical protein